MKRLHMYLWTGLFVLAAGVACKGEEPCSVKSKTANGVQQYVLENQYVRLTFIPAQGGVCASFLYKPAKQEWTTGAPGGCMFEDHSWHERYSGDWQAASYTARVLANTAEQASLELLGQGKTGDQPFMSFRKTVTLTRSSPAVRVRYAFEVANEAMSEKRVGLWFHNAISVPKGQVNFFIPKKDGVQRLSLDPATPPDERFEYEPRRGWMAATTSQGPGLALRMDYRNLMCFYRWSGENIHTMEWMLRDATIPHGSKLETDVVAIPFDGLKDVAGAGAGGVASLNVPGEGKAGAPVNAAADVVLASGVHPSAVWSFRKLPSEVWTTIKSAAVAATLAKPQALAAEFVPDADGVYVLRLQVVDDKEVLVEAEKPLIVGAPAQKYEMIAECEREGNPADRFGKLALKAEETELPMTGKVVTPHVEWAKPYWKGKTKALFLMHHYNAREVVELAERMDLDYDAPLVDTDSRNCYVGDIYGKSNMKIVEESLRKHLKKEGWDVIVIAGFNFKAFDSGLAALIKAHLDKGVGLVYIGPGRFQTDEPWANLPVKYKESIRASRDAKWSAEGAHFISAGVPIETLPTTGLDGCPLSSGQVFITAQAGNTKYPLGIAREQNNQRTVVFNWRSSNSPGYGDCLTPFVRFAKERFNYWEYQHSLLAKAILWAARKDGDARVEIAAEPPSPVFGQTPVIVRVKAAGQDAAALGPCQVQCTVRDKYWREIVTQTLDLNPKGGAAEGAVELKQTLPVGVYFADTVLRCQGKTVAWGSLAFNVKGPVCLSSFKLPETPPPAGVDKSIPRPSPMFKTGDNIVADAEIANAGEGLVLRAEFTDGLGRLVARQELPVPAGAKSAVKVSFAVEHPLAHEGVVRVRLFDKNQLIDEADVDFMLAPDRVVSSVWDDYEMIPWGAMGGYDQHYLVPFRAKLAKDAGITTLYPNGGWSEGDYLRWEQESSYRAGFRLIETGMWQGEVNKWEDDHTNYLKTKDKKYLERKPSLSDTAYLAQCIDRVRKNATAVKDFLPLAWMWGDEMNVIGGLSAFDYDFSPYGLREFRQWLGREYGTLEALNREWRTDYRLWDDVVPLTEAEAKEKNNYASWADMRAFMEYSFTQFYATLIRTLREVSPNCLTGLCGTQAPTAYNGCDWPRLMTLFTYMQPYYYQGMENVMPALNPAMPKACWSTGYGGTDSSKRGVWSTFLSGNRGTSFFSLHSFFNPDLTLTKSAIAASQCTEPLRKGLGKLWSTVLPEFDSIAVLYSQRAIQGAYIRGGEWFRAHQGWFDLLHDFGYSPKFVTTQQLESGDINPALYKVLILPMVMPLSRNQAFMLNEYVQAGGVLLADNQAGIMDWHCQILPAGTLDALFGLKRTGPAAKGPEGDVKFTAHADLDLSQVAGNTALPEGNIAVAGDAVALGAVANTPVAVYKKTGAGRSCYLNLEIAKFSGVREQPGGEFFRQLGRRLMGLAGLQVPYSFELAGAAPKVYRQREGNNLYVGYLRPAAASWKLRLPEKKHAYNVPLGKYLGETNVIESENSPQVANLFALLPYKVAAVSVTPAAQEARPGERLGLTLAVTAEGGEPGRHVLRVTVRGPDNREVSCYSGNVLLAGGKGAFEVPFALNDSPGEWKIDIRDVATGAANSVAVTLRKD